MCECVPKRTETLYTGSDLMNCSNSEKNTTNPLVRARAEARQNIKRQKHEMIV